MKVKWMKNQNGHYCLSFEGSARVGRDEITYLQLGGVNVGIHAQELLRHPDYDEHHRLVSNQVYNVVLIPGWGVPVVQRSEEDIAAHRARVGPHGAVYTKTRGAADIQEFARLLGYGPPLAGMVPRIREVVSDEDMEAMGFWYIMALHQPIPDVDGQPRFLHSIWHHSARTVGTCVDSPFILLGQHGAIAFSLP